MMVISHLHQFYIINPINKVYYTINIYTICKQESRMHMFDIFRLGRIKAELAKTKQERDEAVESLDKLKHTIEKLEHLSYLELQQAIKDLEAKQASLLQEAHTIQDSITRQHQWWKKELQNIEEQIEQKKKDIVILDDEILLQSYGFYKPKYGLINSEAYKLRLEQIRQQQANMVKNNTAINSPSTFLINNDAKEGMRTIKDYSKLIIRAFNNEADSAIGSAKFNNVDALTKRLQKAYDTLNKLAARLGLSIDSHYLTLKLEELYLNYEYQLKKQEEKEEQQRIREQLREEAKVQKEIEELKRKVDKELIHFSRALASVNAQLAEVTDERQRALLEQEKASIQENLKKTEHIMEDVLNRERNTRAGYVYIISNIGSFGENVYKIGLTRRLEPQERIDELGDASVPFRFDVHALIFSEDAPALENALHQAFIERRVNMINPRREFFRVTLEEIEHVIKNNFNKPVEIIRFAEAEEYRQSIMILQERAVSN